MSQPLAGLRILVIEEEFLIALDMEQLCSDNGAANVAIVNRMAPPYDLPDCDVAILDLKLSGPSTAPLAQHLRQRGVPFVLVSGYQDREELSRQFPGAPVLQKPYMPEDLLSAVTSLAVRPGCGL